jgi:hypothetical protein
MMQITGTQPPTTRNSCVCAETVTGGCIGIITFVNNPDSGEIELPMKMALHSAATAGHLLHGDYPVLTADTPQLTEQQN